MDPVDEKFFEELAGITDGGDKPKPEIQLVKASFADTKKKTAAIAKTFPKKTIDESESEGQLTVDVYQTPSEIIIESAIAGVKPEDLDVTVSSDSVTIKGERQREENIKEEDYFYRECYWGKFSRSVILPQEIDPDTASVTFKNGILTVRLPKKSKEKVKKLKVKIE